jgi:hypothetical protein
MGSELLLVIVVATALVFDFTNGFHDTANAMATSIATGIVDGDRRRRVLRGGAHRRPGGDDEEVACADAR